ncbi:MAG: porphobilinogen synthase [Candidatus Kapaibacterium sp.]
MMFKRFRRLRENPLTRAMIRETRLHKSNLIYPMFVMPGENKKEEVSSMPGVFRMSVDNIKRECEALTKLGIPGIILFGIPESKDETATGAYDENGIIQKCLRELKKENPDILLITDVCLCEYTSHGHCGLIKDGGIANDETLKLLQRTALSQAEAGADMIAPSDMMDGRIAAIREVLDSSGFNQMPLMSYAVKYSSAYYGPFRDAAGSAPSFGDRRSHQMDYSNSCEALREAGADIEEGADIIMVKPAGAYLDIIRAVSDSFNIPVSAYQVSGEYAMIKAAAERGWLDENKIIMESLTSIKRAGAYIILTYYAKEAAKLIEQNFGE